MFMAFDASRQRKLLLFAAAVSLLLLGVGVALSAG